MKLIKPYYSVLTPVGIEMLKNIERAGRTCYKSEDQITENSCLQFIRMLIKKGHESVLEHEKVSVLFVCDRGVSHELVRHRIASFSQESTRYCNYSKDKFGNELTFVIPSWFKTLKYDNTEKVYDFKESVNRWYAKDNCENDWVIAMLDSETTYNNLIASGWSPQQARSILPNSLKTEIVVTANLREWRTIFKQRTSPAAHPQMRELMCPLLDELKKSLPVIFEDIKY